METGRLFFFSQQRVPYENIQLTEDNNYSRNDNYIDRPDSDSAIPLMRSDGYDRLVRENVRFEYEIWL